MVESIVEKYGTRNPIKIANDMGIQIIYEPLGMINGYFTTMCRHRQIHINSELDERRMFFTAAHELGHAILPPHENTPFLKSTLLSVNKLEREANLFAVKLMISDDDLEIYNENTIQQLSCIYGLPAELIELRKYGRFRFNK